MDIFDLLFIALFFAAVVSLITAGVAALIGRRARALRILRVLGVSAALYFGIVCMVSAATPRGLECRRSAVLRRLVHIRGRRGTRPR